MKRLTKFILLLAFIAANALYAQPPNLVQMEYYFDDDPGFGLGQQVSFSFDTTIDVDFEADLSLVEAGFHKLFIRVKDENGKWSLVHRQDVYKADQPVIPEPLPELVKMEYYFDDDPGFGMGVNVPITATTLIDENFETDLSLVEAGFHKLFVRVKNENGKWSLVHRQDVYKADQPVIPEPLSELVKMEYYFDDDPGFGMGVDVPINAASLIDENFEADLSLVEAGFHKLFVRVKDENGKWSLVHRQDVYKADEPIVPEPLPDVVKMEYYFDDDPGFGMGVEVPLTAASLIDENFEADLSLVEAGFHKLFVRVKDENGKWSLAYRQDVYIADQPFIPEPAPNLIKMEYFVDTDPGFGQGIQVEASPDQVVSIDFNPEEIFPLDSGYHVIRARVMDENGKWSLTHSHDLDVYLAANFKADKNIILENETVQFTDLSSGDPTSWAWDFDNDGIVESTLPNPHYTFTELGSYTVTLAVFDSLNYDDKVKTEYIRVGLGHTIELQEGFQLTSSHMLPFDPDYGFLMTGVLENLVYARNSDGDQFIEFAGQWQNGIGNWNIHEGYLMKMNGDDTVTLIGEIADPQTTIELFSGFQFIAYLPQEPMDAAYAFGDILDNLEYARNSSGEQLIQFFGTWQNGIGDLVPGEGYLLKMSGNDELLYPLAPEGYTRKQKQKPEHFMVSGGNPAEAVWTVYIDPAFGEPGDEVGIFDGDLLVGSGMIESDDILDNDIPVFGNLYTPGNEPSIRIWRKETHADFEIQNFSFDDLYDNAWIQNEFPAEDGRYSFVRDAITGINESTENLISIFPNPAKDQVTVVSGCLAGAEIEIQNQLGEICLKTESVESTVKLDVSGLTPGVYLISISCDDNKVVKKLIIK